MHRPAPHARSTGDCLVALDAGLQGLSGTDAQCGWQSKDRTAFRKRALAGSSFDCSFNSVLIDVLLGAALVTGALPADLRVAEARGLTAQEAILAL